MLDLAYRIRTKSCERLLTRTSISPDTLNTNLLGLFIDRKSIDTSFRRFFGRNKDRPLYRHCQSLNDARTIDFHQRVKQESDVFDEKRQIWIPNYVDLETDDLFIPKEE